MSVKKKLNNATRFFNSISDKKNLFIATKSKLPMPHMSANCIGGKSGLLVSAAI